MVVLTTSKLRIADWRLETLCRFPLLPIVNSVEIAVAVTLLEPSGVYRFTCPAEHRESMCLRQLPRAWRLSHLHFVLRKRESALLVPFVLHKDSSALRTVRRGDEFHATRVAQQLVRGSVFDINIR